MEISYDNGRILLQCNPVSRGYAAESGNALMVQAVRQGINRIIIHVIKEACHESKRPVGKFFHNPVVPFRIFLLQAHRYSHGRISLVHVSNMPLELIEYLKSKDMVVEAYSPVAHGQILNHPEIASMAEKYGVTVAQLCIRYCVQLDALPLPKSASLVHMQENAAVDFVISDADMELLKNMEHIKDYGEHSVFPVFSGK